MKNLLRLLAYFYQAFLAIRYFFWRMGLFKSKRFPLTVISIGNITLGGTGKTPFVKWFVKRLLAKGKKVAILTRGYRALTKGLSDEALELKTSFPGVPVWVGKDRVRLVAKAVSDKMDAVVLDDGFQYWRLARDLDIVLIDATNPFGNGRVLPRGILRETPSSLRRADLFVLTRTEKENRMNGLERFLKACAPEAPILFSIHRIRRFYEGRTKKEIPLEFFKGKKVIPFCGIGNPQAFYHLLGTFSLKLLEAVSFMDHHRYQKKDLVRLDRLAESLQADYLMTTEKDLERLALLNLWPSTTLAVAEVELVVTKNEDKLFQRLDPLLSR